MASRVDASDCSSAISRSGITSESMTSSSELRRSWLRSKRAVSKLASTSSEPPDTKPAISTRWYFEMSSFGVSAVSIGIS